MYVGMYVCMYVCYGMVWYVMVCYVMFMLCLCYGVLCMYVCNVCNVCQFIDEVK